MNILCLVNDKSNNQRKNKTSSLGSESICTESSGFDSMYNIQCITLYIQYIVYYWLFTVKSDFRSNIGLEHTLCSHYS